MGRKGVPEKYISLVKYMYNQSETVVKCAVGTSNYFTVEVGLHQCSALSPFLSAIIMDVPTEAVRKSAPWQMLFADDVVLSAEERKELEEELEKWRDAFGKKGMKVSRARTENMCLHGTSRGGVRMESHQLPEVTEFKYLGSTLQSNRGADAQINKRTVSGVLCDKREYHRESKERYTRWLCSRLCFMPQRHCLWPAGMSGNWRQQ